MIPFIDLKAQYHSIKDEIDAAISRVLESGQFVLGKEVENFEKEFSSYCGCQYGVGVNSGTSALHLALLAAGIGEGDEVITVPFSFVATVAAICYTRATPVLVDIDLRSYTIDVSQIEKSVTEQTKALIPVHLYGQPADMDSVIDIARRHNLIVIEDAAQAHGAECKGRRVGSIGAMGCFSFYPGKNLGAYGEGGMVVTDNPEYARKIRLLRDWGQERKHHHILKGYNYRMDNIQGAILRVKLRHLDEWICARRRHADLYTRCLKESRVETPVEMPYSRHVYHIYAIRSKSRDRLQQELSAKGIHTGLHYPTPIHLIDAYRDLGYDTGDFPVAEELAQNELSLPMYPELKDSQIEFICKTITTCTATRGKRP